MLCPGRTDINRSPARPRFDPRSVLWAQRRAWTPDGMLLMAQGGSLHGWRRGDADWTRVAGLEALGLHGVTRIAVSPKGGWIAFVTQP